VQNLLSGSILLSLSAISNSNSNPCLLRWATAAASIYYAAALSSVHVSSLLNFALSCTGSVLQLRWTMAATTAFPPTLTPLPGCFSYLLHLPPNSPIPFLFSLPQMPLFKFLWISKDLFGLGNVIVNRMLRWCYQCSYMQWETTSFFVFGNDGYIIVLEIAIFLLWMNSCDWTFWCFHHSRRWNRGVLLALHGWWFKASLGHWCSYLGVF